MVAYPAASAHSSLSLLLHIHHQGSIFQQCPCNQDLILNIQSVHTARETRLHKICVACSQHHYCKTTCSHLYIFEHLAHSLNHRILLVLPQEPAQEHSHNSVCSTRMLP